MSPKDQANVMVQRVVTSLPAVISAIIIALGAARVYYGDRTSLIATQDAKMKAMEANIIKAFGEQIAESERRTNQEIERSTANRWTLLDQAKFVSEARRKGVDLPEVWEVKKVDSVSLGYSHQPSIKD